MSIPVNAISCLRFFVIGCLTLASWNVLDAKAQEVDASLFAKQMFEAADGTKLPYRFVAPSGQDHASETKYPLVLFLHGAGERGDDNEAQLKHGIKQFALPERLAAYPAFLVAPQCPKDLKWVETDWTLAQGEGSFPEQPSGPMAKVFQLIDQICQTHPVDTNRLYVTGLSMGGYGSWYAAGYAQYAKANPELVPPQLPVIQFAAMLAICGGGDPLWAGHYDHVPIWAVHGDADTAVRVNRSREMIQAITGKGHPGELRYTELIRVGHDSWTQTYARDEVYRWLFAQRQPGS